MRSFANILNVHAVAFVWVSATAVAASRQIGGGHTARFSPTAASSPSTAPLGPPEVWGAGSFDEPSDLGHALSARGVESASWRRLGKRGGDAIFDLFRELGGSLLGHELAHTERWPPTHP